RCVGTGDGSTTNPDVRNGQTCIDWKPQARFTLDRSEIDTSIRKMWRRARGSCGATTAADSSLPLPGIQIWTLALALSEGSWIKRQEKHHHTQDAVFHYEPSEPFVYHVSTVRINRGRKKSGCRAR